MGAFIPNLSRLLVSGAQARAGDLNLVLVIATATAAVVAGDALGNRTGHLLGSRLRTGRLERHIPGAAWQRTQTLMTRRGGQAVFLSRFVPVVRTLTPHLAGATRLAHHRTAPYSLLAPPCGPALRPSSDTPRPLPSSTSSPSAGRPSSRPWQ
ncbi:DedA family protein [Streptomyces griseoluteus]|uniref:DedA family protein n=1 Tax=Streptomyces griseoluteus TaxID=29306 RepID=UPI003687857D